MKLKEQGSRITFYFYSTNCEGFKWAGREADRADRAYLGYKSMNWPYYLVWDEYQADFIHRVAGSNANVRVVGSIWFSTSASEIPELPPRAIAVFDIQPVRNAFYNTLGVDFDYYTPEVVCKFLSDSYKAMEGGGCKLVLKRKREIGKLAHPLYRNRIKELERLASFVEVEADSDASQIIEHAIAVISMPFTSTALIAKEMGKPSIYYDPTGRLQRDDRAAHGIPILSGIEELEEWISARIAI